ncbi:hypothetical protein ECDEC9E_5668 [Escherichia coli DEC9E]|nr:hypothetical protein ECDEC9E_5668 [Escherichia coli DEC9E]
MGVIHGEKPEIAIVPQSLHRLIHGPDKRTTPPLDGKRRLSTVWQILKFLRE